MDFATRIRPGPKPFLGPAAWAVLFALLFAALASRLGTDASFDFKNYHFYNGFAAYHDRTGLDIVPAQLQTAFYYGLDAIYYDLFTSLNGHPVLLNMLLSLPYAVAAVALFLMARVFVDAPAPWRDIVCALAAIVGVTGASSLSTLATTMTEVVPGLPLLVGLTLWLRFEKAERITVWTALPVGALAGLSVAFKLTEAPLFIGMVLAIGARLGIGARSALAEAIAFSLAGLVVFSAVDAAWLMGNARAYGNPVFPLFNDVFKSDLISASPWTDLRFMPKTRIMAVFYPAYWAFRPSFDASELIMRDPRILLGCVSALVILVTVLVKRFRNRALPIPRFDSRALFLAIVFLVSYGLWEKIWSVYRYLAIQECLSGVLILAALTMVAGPRLKPMALCGLFALVAGWTMWTTVYPWWQRAPRGPLAVFVNLPRIESNAMVLFLDPQPYAYLVPWMPHTARAVGVNNNLVRPDSPGRLETLIDAAIRDHNGPLWGLENPGVSPGAADFSLSSHRLVRDSQCAWLDGNLESDRSVRIAGSDASARPPAPGNRPNTPGDDTPSCFAAKPAPAIAVLAPCHNEATTIAEVVRGFRASLPEALIYVYDNNSTDGTAEAARRAGADRAQRAPAGQRACRAPDVCGHRGGHLCPGGRGRDIRRRSGAQPGRGTDGRAYDQVNGARVAKTPEAYRPSHALGNKFLSGLVSLIFGARSRDMLSGYKVLSRRFVKSFPAMSTGFEIETELLVHCAHSTCRPRRSRPTIGSARADRSASYRPSGTAFAFFG